MQYLPGSDLNVYCREREREELLMRLWLVVIWSCVAIGISLLFMAVR